MYYVALAVALAVYPVKNKMHQACILTGSSIEISVLSSNTTVQSITCLFLFFGSACPLLMPLPVLLRLKNLTNLDMPTSISFLSFNCLYSS